MGRTDLGRLAEGTRHRPCGGGSITDRFRWRRLLVAGAAGLLLAPAAPAATFVWSSGAGGDFLDPGNWSAAPGPGAGDLAIFNNDLNDTITLSGDATVHRIQVRNSAGVLEFDTGDHTLTLTDYALIGSADDSSKVRLSRGEIQSSTLIIGSSQTNSVDNHVTVTGPDALWTTTSTGAGIRVGGNGGTGARLDILDGGRVAGAGQVVIGLQGASNSTLTVSGEGSELSTATSIQLGGNNTVGPAGANNRLDVIHGGDATGGWLLLGLGNNVASTHNSVQVSGAGSSLTLTGPLSSDYAVEIGVRYSDNAVRVADLAQVTLQTGGVLLGAEAGSTNNLLHLDGGTMALQESGAAVEIRQGEVRLDAGTLTAGAIRTASASGVIQHRGGTLAVGGAQIATGSALVVGDGGGAAAVYRMTDPAGSHTFADGLQLNADGRLEGSGTITGHVSALVDGATASVGQSLGRIDVAGDWDNRHLALLLEVGDLSGGAVAGTTHDLLNIAGTFTHGGEIVIDLTEYVAASTPEAVRLLQWGAASGLATDTQVTFVNGSALPYEITGEGLSLIGVPEPTACGLLAGGGLLGLLLRRRSRLWP